MPERRFGSIRRLPRPSDDRGRPTGRWQITYACPTCAKKHAGELTFDHPARLVKTDHYPAGVPGRALKAVEAIRDDIEAARITGVPYPCFRAKRASARPDEEVVAGAAAAATPFGEYARTWLDNRTVTKPLKPRTAAGKLRLFDKEIFPTFEQTPLDQLTVDAVDTWWERLRKKHPTRHKCNRDSYELLKQVMTAAVRDRRQPLIVSNPCQIHPDDIPKCKAKRMQVATFAEINGLAAAMPERLTLLIYVAAWSGLRFGEFVELRRRDIDVTSDFPLLRVERAYSRVDGVNIVDEPKSEAGIRTVRLPDFLKPMIKHQLDTFAQPGPDGLIFTAARPAPGSCECTHPGCIGGHLLHATFHRSYFRPARKKIGRPTLRVHDLRHTGATLAAQNGATLAELMRRIGHSTPQAAMIYQHATDERDEELARRMSRSARQANTDVAASNSTAAKPSDDAAA